MENSVDVDVENAMKAVDAQIELLPTVFVNICRKATAIASNSGFEANPIKEQDTEENEKIVDQALKIAKELEELLDETCDGNGRRESIYTLVEDVLIHGKKKRQPDDNLDEEVIVTASGSRANIRGRRGRAADGRPKVPVLAEPDVVFTKCPLTQEPFRFPVSQRWSLSEDACCHVFEQDAIEHHMKDRSTGQPLDAVPCPFAGCGAIVHRASLSRDVETEEHMRRDKLKEAHDRLRKDVTMAAEAARVGVAMK